MFTINNPVAKTLPDRFTNNSVFSIFQLEKGDAGTPHLQGYLVLKPNPKNKNGYTLKWLKDNVCPFTHWEPRRGTHEQAVAYCSKEATRVEGPWTHGEWIENDPAVKAKAGSKGGAVNGSKILAIKRKIDDGVDESELYEQHFGEMLRYAKAFDRYKMVKKEKFRKWQTKAFVFYGPSGTGKSMAAAETAEANFGSDVYHLQLTGSDRIWWDGYTGQKCVIIDEFYGQIKISYLLNLLDRYPMQVETKGSYVPFLAEVIFITSNEHPRMWYGKGSAPGEPSKIPVDVLNALQRRFEGKCGTIKEFKDKIVIPDDNEPDASDLLMSMVGATERYHADELDAQMAADADDDVDDKKVIDLTCDEVLDATPEDAWQQYEHQHNCSLHTSPYPGCCEVVLDDFPLSDVEAARLAAAQDLEEQHLEASQTYGDIGRPTKLRRTDTTRFELIPPPTASPADFRKVKQIPGQAKLALAPVGPAIHSMSGRNNNVNDDED